MYVGLAREILKSSISHPSSADEQEDGVEGQWKELWKESVDVRHRIFFRQRLLTVCLCEQTLLADRDVSRALKGTFDVARDVGLLCRILASLFLGFLLCNS